ncbi:unnamed protein product [Adineta steineri]|uniref:F-box domain-containing protein n=1 Tax=Adineta steineri TaxID=433720 RepID=A0A818XBQ5_9BILA|nr:unnamed protein product [Adineta steineri]CAF3738120.1 unnamed protein product [Adineta steineri]
MSLVLEDLPNELFLSIFKHLSVIDLLHSFYSLNHRFSSLIRTIPHLHVDFSSQPLSQTQFIHITNQLRSLNIESVQISIRYYTDAISFFISSISPSKLHHLRSLTLIDADRTTIEKFVHKYPKLTSLSIESSVWRSIPSHSFLSCFPNLTYCHLPTFDFLHDCHIKITKLKLDHCTTENLIQLNTFVPNLKSLTLTLNNNTKIPPMLHFPVHLISLNLILHSVLFTEFERLIIMIEHLENLTVSFRNTEHEVYCFDQYLFGKNWYSIKNYVDNLEFNIIVNQTSEAYLISEMISNFEWFRKKIICQTIDHTNGYHLFTLPFIDKTYTINLLTYQSDTIFSSNDFNRVHHLHLTIPNKDLQNSLYISSYGVFRNLQILTVIISTVNNNIISFIDYLLLNSCPRTLELRFTSITNTCCDYFDKLIYRLPPSIEILILNTTSTKFLSELLDNNNQLLPNIKRLLCSVKNQDDFDLLILLLLDVFHDKSLIYLNISLEKASRQTNFVPGWLRKTNYLKKARIKCSDRQCAIWIW